MDYIAWNDAIGSRFFHPDRAGQRVFLFVTKEIIAEIGAPQGVDLDDFIEAVKTGPDQWVTRHKLSICQHALQVMENWRKWGLVYPPYLSYLALFVLADTVEVEGFARFSYYPGLRQVLGEDPEAGSYPSFDKMYALWFDLEQWSIEDKGGAWGLFRADILGRREYVGLPKAQTILTDDERHKLPLLFAEYGFDPTSPPSDRELSHLLAHESHHYLMPRTKEILGRHADMVNAMYEVLLDAILDELLNWDGSVAAHAEQGSETESSIGNLRLTMMLDSTARTVRFGLRCRSNREYPEEGLHLAGSAISELLVCREDWQGWSFPLANAGGSASVFDAYSLDWREGLSLVDCDHSWKAILSKRPVRIMVNAEPYGFSGFLEQSQLPQGRSTYLLVRDEHTEAIQTWGRSKCDGFSEVVIAVGLPKKWRLFSIARVNSDEGIRDAFPYLAFPTILRIQFIGGLRVKGNQYFSFALPRIEITGAIDSVDVFCNDHLLDRDSGTGLYSIPEVLCARRLVVEVKSNGERVSSRSIYSIEPVTWRGDIELGTGMDRYGRCSASGAKDRCVGPIVEGVTLPLFEAGMFLPPGAGHRVYFIGQNPGEIVELPTKKSPTDWRPVWAVLMHGGKGIAVYCGVDPANEAPGTVNIKDRRCRQLWREVLWTYRKRIDPPTHPAVAQLWREYKKVAELVN